MVEIHAKKKSEDNWEVYTENGREPTGLNVLDWINTTQKLGAGEVFLISVDKDGSKSGFDFELAKQASKICDIPLIFGSGASKPSDAVDIFKLTTVDALSFGNILHFNNYTIKDIKDHLIKNGIEIRK